MSNEKLISDYIQLQKDYHFIYFALQEKISENEKLRKDIEKIKSDYLNLQTEHEKCNHVPDTKIDSELKHENKELLAKVKQLQRDSPSKTIIKMVQTNPINSNKTPSRITNMDKNTSPCAASNETPKPTKHRKGKNYEVDSLIGHRKYRGRLQFLVRWKNYSSEDDRWVDEKNLNCPALLKNYKKANQM